MSSFLEWKPGKTCPTWENVYNNKSEDSKWWLETPRKKEHPLFFWGSEVSGQNPDRREYPSVSFPQTEFLRSFVLLFIDCCLVGWYFKPSWSRCFYGDWTSWAAFGLLMKILDFFLIITYLWWFSFLLEVAGLLPLCDLHSRDRWQSKTPPVWQKAKPPCCSGGHAEKQ